MADPSIADRQEFLLRVAELLHRHGTPSHRLERVMTRISQQLGIDASYLYTPTALLVSFNGPAFERTKLLRVDAGEADLGKLFEFDEALEDLDHRRADLTAVRERIELIAAASPRYSTPLSTLAAGLASACATVFFGGGAYEMLVAGCLGPLIFLLGRWLARFPHTGNLLEAVAGFSAAILSIVFSATVVPIDDRLTTLGAIIILLPGLMFTVAMTELATRHLSSGVARLAGSGVVFLTLAVGIALAWRIGAGLRPVAAVPVPVSPWGLWIALAISPFAFAILYQARRRQWPVICAVSWLGFLAAQAGAIRLGPEFGPFVGALVIGALSNLYARLRDHPAMVPQIPAILILVPGSIGFRSVAAFLENNALAGLEFAFSMFLIAVSIAGGLLAANALIPPRRVL